MKKTGIMQPYFLPYMGYWQLLNLCDEFILYDNIQYTKKGWINRNRYFQNGKDVLFSIPLKSDSDFLPIVAREISPSYDRAKLVRQLKEAYRKAPYFNENFACIEEIILNPGNNLFAYIADSVRKICAYLEIDTEIVISSRIPIDHDILKAQDKVIALCKARGGTDYINPIGGVELYSKDDFDKEGIALSFLRSRALTYDQFGAPCLPHLSVLDVLMFNSREQTISYLKEYDLE